MKTMIENYQSFPGEHCGSVAMRGLLNHYCQLALPEPAVFGLSAGIASVYMELPVMQPGVVIFGRSMSLESDLADILQVDYREQPDEDDDHAWQVVCDEVLAGRPTMLSGDILYLDYREYKVHFPGHRFVLLGFDDAIEKAFIADRIRGQPEACSYGALRESRNPPEGLSTHNLWGRFHGSEVGRSLRDATAVALERAATSMLGVQLQAPEGLTAGVEAPTVVSGVAGIEHFAAELPGWAKRPDVLEVASFNASCIEKFGNGGGNFRRLYAGFLDWARQCTPDLVPPEAPALARRAADGWTAASTHLYHVAQQGPAPELFDAAAREIEEVAQTERRLFESLAAA
ncbi:MAG: BtrH N-terminal domain-containing protein [bacterium]|nr:BtrH N-terminal domain-containing protein [bacterium]